MRIYIGEIKGKFVDLIYDTKKHRYKVLINDEEVMDLTKTQGEKLIEFFEKLGYEIKYQYMYGW